MVFSPLISGSAFHNNGGLECVHHSFAYFAHFVLLRDVWIRTQGAVVASRSTTNLATHLPFIIMDLVEFVEQTEKISNAIFRANFTILKKKSAGIFPKGIKREDSIGIIPKY
jgi:hypothetical protein